MSTNQHVLTVHQEAVAERPQSLLEIIQRVVDGPLDLQKVEVLERLLTMQERVEAEQRRIAFDDAMTRLQAKLPHIAQYGKGKNNKFSKYEDIDAIIRPM